MFKYTQFDEKTPLDLLEAKQKRIHIGFGLLTLFSLACWSFTLVFFLHQSNQIINLQSELGTLQNSVQNSMKENENNFQEQKILSRQKRQAPNDGPDFNAAEKSGVPIFDHAYGDHEDTSRVGYQLAIYPKLMGDLDDGQAYHQGLNQNNQPQNTQPAEISWGNRLNHRRMDTPLVTTSTTSKPLTPKKNLQSAYARRVSNSHRRSRVSSTPEQLPPLREVFAQPDPILYDDSEDDNETENVIVTPRPVPKPLLKSLDSDASRLFDSNANPIISIHLQARHSLDESSSDLNSGSHNSWRLSQWSKRLHGATLFTMDEEAGTIEIPTDGLYLVYAQIEYLDVHDTNGFEINVDDEATMSCVTSTLGQDEETKKHNTCHTSGVLFLQRGSLLNIKDKEVGRYSLLHSKGTFFGVAKISSC